MSARMLTGLLILVVLFSAMPWEPLLPQLAAGGHAEAVFVSPSTSELEPVAPDACCVEGCSCLCCPGHALAAGYVALSHSTDAQLLPSSEGEQRLSQRARSVFHPPPSA